MTNDARDTRLSWALHEALGNEAPPDLVERTVARFAAGDGVRVPQPVERRQPRRWSVALASLLAAAVVAAFALWPRQDPSPGDASAQEPQKEPSVAVRSRSDIEALPATCTAVVGTSLDDDAVRALARLRNLQHLELRYPETLVRGLGLKTPPPDDPPCITGATFATLSQFAQLRTLRILGAHAMTESFPAGATDHEHEAITERTLDHLSRLPVLRELALSHFDVPAYALAVLPRLSALRTLDLSANYGVDAEAIEHIVRCHSLHSLSLQSCMAIPGSAIARLAVLPNLQDLDVGNIDGMDWRSGGGDFLGPATHHYQALAHAAFARGDCGVTDLALRALSTSTTLRTLLMPQPHCTQNGMQSLRDFAALERLDVFGFDGAPAGIDELADWLPPLLELSLCGDFGDTFCKKLRDGQPRLRHLEIPACYEITDRGLADLLRIASLRHLNISQSRGLTKEALPLLLAAVQLEYLDVSHIDWVTQEHLEALQRSLPNLRTLRDSVEDEDGLRGR